MDPNQGGTEGRRQTNVKVFSLSSGNCFLVHSKDVAAIVTSHCYQSAAVQF